MGLFSKLKEKIEAKKLAKEEYQKSLSKSNKGLVNELNKIKKSYGKNAEYFDALEELLISADVGVKMTLNIIDSLKDELKKNKDANLNELLVDKMIEMYNQNGIANSELNIKKDGNLNVLMVVGVNGVGKTTSIAKIANIYKKLGYKILLAAADTFRAGAVEQLNIWANKLDIDIVCGKDNADPSSVIYDATYKASKEKYDLLICDTSGRMQSKKELMDELAKMNRIVKKVKSDGVSETLLVLDATSGQNGIIQAKAFFDASSVSGIILSKMDSTSKGGIILSIKDELNIPVKFICFGEGINDIISFDIDNYIYELTNGLEV